MSRSGVSAGTPEGGRADVLVVGGGPAGSTVAWSLVQRGLDVVVLDRCPFPRDKVCAGWITPAVVELLHLDLEDYGAERVLQPIHGFRVGVMGREVATGVEERPLSYGIRRCEFDAYLLARSGARASLGEEVRTIERRGETWLVNGRWRAPWLVGAGGHACPVARWLNPDEARGRLVVGAQEIEPALSDEQLAATRVDGRVPLLSFCPDLAGYGWVFRKGRYLNVGLGREGARALRPHVDRYVGSLAARGEIPPDLTARFRGHAYLLYSHPPRRVAASGVVLAGDAAGLAHPRSGEGIRPAVESALLAADTIGGRAADVESRYAARLVARFGPRRPPAALGWLPPAARAGLGRALLASGWFNRRVVVDRWFLQRDAGATRGSRGRAVPPSPR
jgi:flavin-dependent dehydrogenase